MKAIPVEEDSYESHTCGGGYMKALHVEEDIYERG